MRHRHPAASAVATASIAVVLAACTGGPAPSPSPTATEGAAPLEVVDPDREALEGVVDELEATITALRTELEAASAGDEQALEAAAALLAADVDAVTTVGAAEDAAEDAADATPPATDLDAPPAVLPGPVVSRAESVQYGDLLTRTLAAARGAGSVGEPVLRFLADPLAGDLGAWQRAPDDQLAAIARAGTASDLEATQTEVLQLEGEAPRALAWVVHGLTTPADSAEAAGRALAHLAVIDLALEQLE